MKEWVKKLIVVLILFGIIYIVLYNTIKINNKVEIPKNSKIITNVNKDIAIASLSVIGVSIIVEIYFVIKYINTTVSHDTFKKNLIKIIFISVLIVLICVLCYFIYILTSKTRIGF